jgi:hypothetical protein
MPDAGDQLDSIGRFDETVVRAGVSLGTAVRGSDDEPIRLIMGSESATVVGGRLATP